ncbi:ATP-binding protein [Succinivibrio dextrinosolvens]|uniref:ATP-binding protein n=1 Tax=Succinivibrio dextrinosolvens TaxID=83771 RepID=UPI0018CC632C|nr:ATP-binding protein [Succinivibrio dextrinosolvens]
MGIIDMKQIQRSIYLDFLIRHIDKNIIKVISGFRRCGKSILLQSFKKALIKNGVAALNIIYIDFEDIKNEDLKEYHSLYKYICGQMQPSSMNYILLDEIQHVSDFEKAVDSLFIKDNADVYITGSNAYFMSGELATVLSGRYVELRMQPLSFKEFYEASSLSQNDYLSEIYEKYVTDSSFPYTIQISGKQTDIQEYLNGIYNYVILNDVVGRLNVSDVKTLLSLIKYVFANIGCPLSVNKITKSINSTGRKIDNKTVERYLTGLLDSLLIYRVDRFDIRGKRFLKQNSKYYVADAALRYLIVGRKGQDTGHILENVIYLELIRRGYEVYVGALRNGEIDFIAKKTDGLCYFQVSESTIDESTLDRELQPLKKLDDNYPKYLLTLDEINAEADYDGIRKMNALKWLLDE